MVDAAVLVHMEITMMYQSYLCISCFSKTMKSGKTGKKLPDVVTSLTLLVWQTFLPKI